MKTGTNFFTAKQSSVTSPRQNQNETISTSLAYSVTRMRALDETHLFSQGRDGKHAGNAFESVDKKDKKYEISPAIR